MQKGNTLTTKILGIFNLRALSGKAGSKMAMWKCGLCVGFAALVLSHVRQVHSGDKDFQITCGILNCEKSYTKYDSFYRHVKNQHHTYLDTPATYLNTDEVSTALRVPNGNEQICEESSSSTTCSESSTLRIFRDLTSLSQTPPMCAAAGGLKIPSMTCWDVYLSIHCWFLRRVLLLAHVCLHGN